MGVFLLGFVSSGVARKGFSLLTKRSWKSRVPIALDLTSERTINEGWKLEIQTVSSSYFKYKNTTRHSYSMTSNSSSCATSAKSVCLLEPFGTLATATACRGSLKRTEGNTTFIQTPNMQRCYTTCIDTLKSPSESER